jgi:hypothetical protein
LLSLLPLLSLTPFTTTVQDCEAGIFFFAFEEQFRAFVRQAFDVVCEEVPNKFPSAEGHRKTVLKIELKVCWIGCSFAFTFFLSTLSYRYVIGLLSHSYRFAVVMYLLSHHP